VTSKNRQFLPYARQMIDEADIAAVSDVLRSDFLTTGPMVEKFEDVLAKTVGSRHAVVCSNGTAALHLAALALGIGPGDRVIVPSITFLATANAVRYVGGEVVFADINPETGQMEPEQLAAAIATVDGMEARAVFPVCLAGATADPAGLETAAAGRQIVYDASHALGTRYRGRNQRGTVGDCRHSALVTFSFHPVKTIALGEGGAVTTNSDTLAEKLRRYRNHGMTRNSKDFVYAKLASDTGENVNPWYYEMLELGYNYRLTDIQCALGLSQIAKLGAFAARRRSLAARYFDRLAPLSPQVRPLGRTSGCDPVLHLFVVLIDFPALGTDRAGAMQALKVRGVGTQVHYIPVHTQPYYVNRYGSLDLPGAAEYYARTLSLPLFVGMTDDDVDRVVETLADTLGIANKL